MSVTISKSDDMQNIRVFQVRSYLRETEPVVDVVLMSKMGRAVSTSPSALLASKRIGRRLS